MPERTCLIRSLPLPTGGRTGSRPGLAFAVFPRRGQPTHGRPAFLARSVVNRLELHAPLLGDTARGGQSLQTVHRRPHHVVRVGRAQALGEDVADPRALEHRAHRATRDDAGPDAAGFSSTRPAPCSPMISCGIVPPVSGTSDMLRRAASTALRTASLTSFALPVAMPTCPWPSPDGDERVEAEAPAALHDLGHAVDRDDVLDHPVALSTARAAPVVTPLTAAAAPPTTTTTPTAATATRTARSARRSGRGRHGSGLRLFRCRRNVGRGHVGGCRRALCRRHRFVFWISH